MSRRGTALALLLVTAAVAAWGVISFTSRPQAADAVPAVLAAPEPAAPAPSFSGPGPAERPAQDLVAIAETPGSAIAGPPASSASTGSGATEAVAALVADLEQLDNERPITFHEDAARVLESFAGSDVVTRIGSGEIASALDEDLDARGHGARVGGALLAVLGALGGPERILERLPFSDHELQRSATAGLVWLGSQAPPTDAVRLRPMEFLALQPRSGLTVLDLEWNRPPGNREVSLLLSHAQVPAQDLVALLHRDLAVLALGVAVDSRADVLDQFRTWLMDRDPTSQQLRPAIVHVLAHARSPAAREVLLRFLEDGQVGDYGKLLARWWLSKQPAMEGDLKVLAAPLMDPDSTDDDRIMAAGALLSRVAEASASDLAQLEELLAMRVLQETDSTARMAAIAALNRVPGGFLRLGALQQALRGEADPRHRKVAAGGLSRTQGPLRAEALAMLRAALGFEQDPGLKDYISQLLAQAEP